jgi:hypothetical protein
LADHSPPGTNAKEGLEELVLARRGLMHPREHVADVSGRIVCVEFDWAGEAIGPAAGEGVEKGGEDGGLAGGGEGG